MFPETSYEVIGFGRDRQGIFRVITKQKFVEGEETSVEDLDKLSKQLNLEKKGSWYYTKDGKRISDLNPKNVLKVPAINDTEEDIFFVIDCDIEFTSEHLQQSDINSTENTQSQKLDTFYSGGATGADTYWSDAMKKHGVTVNHIQTNDYTSLDTESRKTINNQYEEVVKLLGRRVLNEYTKGGQLVRRDIIQANNATSIFAVGNIITNSNGMSVVDGGTGYAVMRGIQRGIPVYVYNQSTNNWTVWDYKQNKFVNSNPKTIQNGAALIGVHGMRNEVFTENGKRAIDELVEKSFSQQSQQLTDEQLTERAYNYTVENLDKLVNDYISNAGNTIDPDAIREVYKPLGYTGKNVPAFRKAEKLLTETIFEKMIDKAVAEGKTSMTFLTGIPGSGKSSSLRNNNMDLSDQGIVYDAAFNGSDKLIKYIKKVQDRGLKNVTVLAVHNDAITSFTNTLNRGIATGRFLSLQYFLDGAFSENIGKIKRLKEKCPDINIIPIDNSGNNGGKQVTVEEAMNWDYNVTEELVYKLLNIIEDEISKGNISGEQITSVGRDVLEIEALVSERNKSIANRINRQIQRNTGNNQGETGLSGLGVNSQSQPTSVLSNLIQPKKGVDLKKATAKASIANKFIGFGAPNSSTALYQQQAGEYANVGNYTKDDTVFVSINGKVKNAIEYQLQTIDEAVKAIRSGARLLTDSAEYLDKSNYNIGEKLLAEHLKLIGATYQTIDIDGEKVGQWTFSAKMQATNITIAQLADTIGNENVVTDRTIATENLKNIRKTQQIKNSTLDNINENKAYGSFCVIF